MPIRQITIVGTGLIGSSLGLALKKNGFKGRIVGCDRASVLKQARGKGAIHIGYLDLADAVRDSQLIVLAAPVGTIIDLIGTLGPDLPAQTLLTDVGSTKTEVLTKAQKVFGKKVGASFLAGHPMAGKEHAGAEHANAELFEGATWFITPSAGQKLNRGISGEFLRWVKKIGARIVTIQVEEHDLLCAWISHLPQMISTALAAALVEEYGNNAPLLEAGGRALREMTRISGSPYSMWRDIALTNKTSIQKAMLSLEQRLAHIRENLDTRELALEFEQAHHLRRLDTKPMRRKLSKKV
ncbi:MAG: prephenate dehydrogenase [Acidobacteriota bacterium]|nr:prephenate dehydrogenase [Acidobacteriota bacterium]